MRNIKYVYFQHLRSFDNQVKDNALIINHCGREECKPLHSYGPAVRDHYLLTYIESGCGTLSINNEKYKLKQGKIFVIPPHVLHHYIADKSNPWTYSWIVFSGSMVASFLRAMAISTESPILSCRNDNRINNIFQEMLKTESLEFGREIKAVGLLYILISELINTRINQGHNVNNSYHSSNKEHILEQAIRFIDNSFSNSISIEEVAYNAGVSRSYLFIIFKEELNISPQQYLTKVRIQHAISLMQQPDLSISQIARSVGYHDPLHFSKTFKKYKRISPVSYRNQLIKD